MREVLIKYSDRSIEFELQVDAEAESFSVGELAYHHDASWLSGELSISDINTILDVPSASTATWLLNNGLCPTQHFRVRVQEPTYSRDYEGEWDVEWSDYEIVWREPLTAEEVASRWAQWIIEGYEGYDQVLYTTLLAEMELWKK